MTSVQHSESVVVRLSDSDQLQLEVANAVEEGTIQVQIIRLKTKLYWEVYNHSCSCACPSAKCDEGQAKE